MAATNESLVVPNGDLFWFGILTSKVHMAWVKVIAGRLKIDSSIESRRFNTFPSC